MASRCRQLRKLVGCQQNTPGLSATLLNRFSNDQRKLVPPEFNPKPLVSKTNRLPAKNNLFIVDRREPYPKEPTQLFASNHMPLAAIVKANRISRKAFLLINEVSESCSK